MKKKISKKLFIATLILSAIISWNYSEDTNINTFASEPIGTTEVL